MSSPWMNGHNRRRGSMLQWFRTAPKMLLYGAERHRPRLPCFSNNEGAGGHSRATKLKKIPTFPRCLPLFPPRTHARESHTATAKNPRNKQVASRGQKQCCYRSTSCSPSPSTTIFCRRIIPLNLSPSAADTITAGIFTPDQACTPSRFANPPSRAPPSRPQSTSPSSQPPLSTTMTPTAPAACALRTFSTTGT